MDHNYYKERISAYADNSLPPYEQMAVQEHIESCAECRSALEKILKLSAWIERETDLRGDDYFEKQAQKIEARLGLAQTEITPIRKKSWQGLGWKLTSVAATIALVGIVVYLSKDTVLQKSETPKETQPTVADTQKPELITGSRLAVPVDSTRHDSSVMKKSTDAKEDDNYKSSPQMMAPSNAPSEPVKDQAGAQQAPPAESAPVMREDVQLQSAAGSQVDSTATVKAKRDVISKFGVSSQLSKTADSFQERPVQRVDDQGISTLDVSNSVEQAPQADSLAFWRSVRDSLENEKKATDIVGKVTALANRLNTKGAPSALAEMKKKETAPLTLAQAYFRIAKHSTDSTEVSHATDSLKKIADDSKSPDQSAAKAYLDSLGVK